MLEDPARAVSRLIQRPDAPPQEQLRQELTAHLRIALEEGRAGARELLKAPRGGFACARRLSAVMDAIVCCLHAAATQHFYPADNPSDSERIAVVAVGGYGRGTLAPGSDVDLLFLFPHKQTAWGESVVEAMLYPLWDLKLKVGHSVRSVDDCMREAKADMTIRTALLEARFLTGHAPLFGEMVRRFGNEVVEGTAAAFTEAKLAERETRVRRAGSSRYLVEPNVKDGKGGLRDLNTLFWIAKYAYRVDDVRELEQAGLFDHSELLMFQRSEEFLWRVRCWMHFITGRAEERLSFDLQRQVAAAIGYQGRRGQAPVERFMKAYFLVAKDVGDLTAIVCAALEARQQKPRATLSKLLGSFAKRRKVRALGHPDFTLKSQRLTVIDKDAFRRDPVNLLRLYEIASRDDLAIHPDASRLVTQSLKLVNPQLRADPEANRIFLEILTGRRSPEVVLRRMNESGLLGRFIPDFGRIVAMMQFNMYHHYTVDEHLIRAMGVLAEIDAGLLQGEHPLANEIMPTISNRRALYIALFLHDIAKGRPDDHSIAGARIARKLGPRLGLTEAQTETVAWLVEHHLDMSTVAQSRDLGDPKTIETFSATVQTLERLKLLLVLTVADIKAVGPGVWNGWKGQLLRTLYYETEIVLAGGHSLIERKARVQSRQDALRLRLSDWSEPEREAYFQRHNPAYWIKTDLARQETDQFRGVTELTVLAPDHPRLLAIVTGACAAAGGNIVDAQIFTTTDGLVLDSISISRAFDRDEDELRRAERIASAIERALKGEIKIADLVAQRRAPPPRGQTFQIAPEVIIDNVLSARHTVLEVAGLDRPGLLYDLTTAIGKLNLNIASAHIATFGEKAVDVFYVTDLTNAKITSTSRQLTIRKTLLEVFAFWHDRSAPAKAKVPARA
ncbi:MAG: [protein-PII] uridylyltransferase [Chelatococcus sp.]|nr:MAG: [protein-PII] uridylyltransferase [Chelatococcus sp.]